MTSRDFRARLDGCVGVCSKDRARSQPRGPLAPATWPAIVARSMARSSVPIAMLWHNFVPLLYPRSSRVAHVRAMSAHTTALRPRRTMNGNGHTRPRSKTPMPTRHHPRHPRGKRETPQPTQEKRVLGHTRSRAHTRASPAAPMYCVCGARHMRREGGALSYHTHVSDRR